MRQATLKTGETVLQAVITDPEERAEAMARWRGEKPARRDKMLTAKEAAAIAGVHKKTIQLWDKKGLLHGRHITARRVRFSRNELEDFLCEAGNA